MKITSNGMFRWLKPRRKRVRNFNPSRSKMLKILFSNGRMKGISFCLNALIVSEFLILGSRWNHSSSEVGKKRRFRVLCSSVVAWNIDIFWVKNFPSAPGLGFSGILVFDFSLFWTWNISVWTIFSILLILNLTLSNFFLLMCVVWHLPWRVQLYIGLILVFHKTIHWKVCHRLYRHNQYGVSKTLCT